MAAQTPGKPIKISAELDRFLRKLKGRSESYDSMLRRQFGLDSRKGEPQPLRTYYILDKDGAISAHKDLADAKGEAILLAVRKGKKGERRYRAEPILQVREVPA